MSITSNLNTTRIKEAVAEATGRARPKRSALDRARSRATNAASEARGLLHHAAERLRQSGRDLTEGASREETPKKKIVATAGAVGAAGAAGAYFLRDRIASIGRQNGQIATPAGQAPVSQTPTSPTDADGVRSA